MPVYTLRWSEKRQITKEFPSVEAANDWWQKADSSTVEDELDYSDCGDLEIELTTSLPAAILECDCPICTILRAEMVDSEREIAVYHLSDSGDHPEMNEAEFGSLIKQELDHVFGAGENTDRYEGLPQTEGYDGMYEELFSDDDEEYFDQEND